MREKLAVTLLVSLLTPLLGGGESSPADTTDFSGQWTNQRRSILILKQTDTQITGTFDSGVGDNNQEMRVPIVGWVNGDRIAFTTTYPKFGTVVAWVGQLIVDESGQEKLITHWLHEADIPDQNESDSLWLSTRTGGDDFARVRKSQK